METATEGVFRIQTGRYSICGEELCIGRDGGDAVTADSGSRNAFSGCRIVKAMHDISDDVYVNVDRELAAAFTRD